MAVHPDVERLALLGWRLHPTYRFSRAACFADAGALTLPADLHDQVAALLETTSLANVRQVISFEGVAARALWNAAVVRALADAAIAPGAGGDVS